MGVTQKKPYCWQASTDEKHVITVDSTLVSCDWEKSAAYCGQKVFYLIYTSFVGNGSPITVRCKTESGQTLAEEEKLVYDNFLRDGFDLPIEMEEGETIYLEVESAPKGLTGASDPIPVYRRPYLENLKWSKEEVEIGDELKLTADVYNVEDDIPAFVTVYQYWDDFSETVTKMRTTVKDRNVKIFFQFLYNGDLDKVTTNREMKIDKDGFYPLRYFFTVTIGTTEYGKENQDSGFIVFKVKWVNVLEFEDELFRNRSAVLLPDRRDVSSSMVSGLSTLAALMIHASKNKDQLLLLLGHAGSGVRDALSLKRATALAHFLSDDKDAWVKSADEDSTDEDIQHLLKWAGYDPGKIDGYIGPDTKRRIKEFQEDSDLKVDGIVGPKTWGAFYERYQAELKDFMSSLEDGDAAYDNRASIQWLFSDKKASICGGLFPKESFENFPFRSESSARIEALFFLPDEKPSSCDCKDGKCKKEECKIFDPKKGWRRRVIDISDEAYQPYSLLGFSR